MEKKNRNNNIRAEARFLDQIFSSNIQFCNIKGMPSTKYTYTYKYMLLQKWNKLPGNAFECTSFYFWNKDCIAEQKKNNCTK